MEKDLNREVHKAEWKVKEQKLQDDIKTLREKLLLLVRKNDFPVSKNRFVVTHSHQEYCNKQQRLAQKYILC